MAPLRAIGALRYERRSISRRTTVGVDRSSSMLNRIRRTLTPITAQRRRISSMRDGSI